MFKNAITLLCIRNYTQEAIYKYNNNLSKKLLVINNIQLVQY